MIESRFLNRRGDNAPTRPVANLKVVGSSSAGNVDEAAKRMRTVVIGCHGAAGANMARFLKLWAGSRLDVTLVVGASVTGIDPYARALTLADGTRLDYDRLEVAPGARLTGSQIAVAA